MVREKTRQKIIEAIQDLGKDATWSQLKTIFSQGTLERGLRELLSEGIIRKIGDRYIIAPSSKNEADPDVILSRLKSLTAGDILSSQAYDFLVAEFRSKHIVSPQVFSKLWELISSENMELSNLALHLAVLMVWNADSKDIEDPRIKWVKTIRAPLLRLAGSGTLYQVVLLLAKALDTDLLKEMFRRIKEPIEGESLYEYPIVSLIIGVYSLRAESEVEKIISIIHNCGLTNREVGAIAMIRFFHSTKKKLFPISSGLFSELFLSYNLKETEQILIYCVKNYRSVLRIKKKKWKLF